MGRDKITTENLSQKIKEATSQLIDMAKVHSWNNISSNVKYVIKKVDAEIMEGEDFFETNRIRKKLLSLKERLNLDSAVKQLISEFENIYLIELYIFKASKKETIVEIEIFEKSKLDLEYRKEVINNPPMLHCKVQIPPYIGFGNETKFDINWQLETFEFKWKIFWWKRKIGRKTQTSAKND